ncbi:FHA domain-containing protein [Oscillatoria salina]|uniref:FHA domain-containing protein n=1 Tax=Oscillatoria salina TaxID=331517 RepID=UPI0013B5C512|nr:FHA domain-containing protein [Oscillatoria salina]MBZ8180734.1 FHA domain-containing protein [Oscillatoria salina IIICB1]NET91071.1 FHA domain-containing protein [Kamptonema sp. SIO1D9]
MKLKVSYEQTGQSWTLKPNREYVVGSGEDCDIFLPNVSVVSERHLKFSFNQLKNTWHLYDLGSSSGTFVENIPVTDYAIAAPTNIRIASGIFLVATPIPDTASPTSAPPAPPPIYTPPTLDSRLPPPPVVPNSTPGIPVTTNRNSAINKDNQNQNLTRKSSSSQPTPKPKLSPLPVLTWKEYVDKQVKKQLDVSSSTATKFCLITGFRNTPWIREYGQTGFRAFDGYIIPNFQGSVDRVIAEIEDNLGQLRQDEDTDCFIAKLTDAHIADSATQKFLGVELFPIRRGIVQRGDYRRFCVVAYHRVRTYLLVEKYGSDLFVSWITRFEPQPTPVIMIVWALVASLLAIVLGSTSQNFFLFLLFPLIWWEIYILTPIIMESMGILPKKANARLIIGLLVVPSFFLISIMAGVSALGSWFNYY